MIDALALAYPTASWTNLSISMETCSIAEAVIATYDSGLHSNGKLLVHFNSDMLNGGLSDADECFFQDRMPSEDAEIRFGNVP